MTSPELPRAEMQESERPEDVAPSLVIGHRTLATSQSREEMKKRGHELDDGFFESFTLDLSEAQVKRRAEREAKLNADEEDRENDVGALFASGWSEPDSSEVQPMRDKELDDAYFSLLKTVHSWLGAEGAQLRIATAESHEYIQKVFSISDEKHEEWLEQLKESIKIPKQFIRVSVIEGQDLPIRDADGSSDPYCVVGLIKHSPELSDGRSKTKHLRDIVDDKTKLKSTTIINNSLNPAWNEEFDIEIEDLTTDCLQFDVWDSDPERGVGDALKNITRIHSFIGFRKYFRHVAKTAIHGAGDDFIGRLYIPLKEIPSEGVEDWRHIANKYQKQKKGQLHLKLQFVSDQKNFAKVTSWDNPFTEHWKLKRQFVRHEANLFKEKGGKRWHGQLKSVALNLLHQHAIQNEITDLQQAAIDWRITSEYNEKVGVDSQYVLQSLTDLGNRWDNCADDPEQELQGKRIKKIVSAVNSYQDWCAAVLSKMRDIYPAAQTLSHKRLALLLQCYYKTFDLALVRKHCPLRQFKESVFKTLVNSTKIWFERQVALSEPQIKSDATETEALSCVALNCFDDLLIGKKVYALAFQNVAIDYLTVTFQHIDSLLAPIIQRRMEAINQSLNTLDLASSEFSKLATATFHLYLAVKEFFQFEDDFPTEVSRGIRLFKMHAWFKPFVLTWFEVAHQKARHRIDRALELNHVIAPLSKIVKHSSSAVDTCTLIRQMRVSWEQLGWPDPSAAYGFVLKVTEYICGAAMYYADKVHEILKQKSYYNNSGEFDVTENLCVTLNDIDYVRMALKPLPETLAWDTIASNLEAENGPEAAKQSKEALHRFLLSADEDMRNKIALIVEKIGEQISVDLSNHANQIIKQPPGAKFEDSIRGLMVYLQSNLQSLHDWLLTTVFMQVLQPTYNLCIVVLLRLVQDRRDLAPSIYSRVFLTLNTLWNFFLSRGKGLSEENMDTDTYKALLTLVEDRQAESPSLISRYLEELNRDLAESNPENRGFLTVLVGYIEPKAKLCIKVLSARDIPALDPNGFSDPYVKFQPYPASAFSGKSTPQQTKVKKQTLTALYDETFYIPTSSNAFRDFKPVLVFHVFDWDRITKDDLAGEAIFSLSSVPFVTSEAEVDGLKQTMMPLWLPPQPNGEIFRVIEGRTWDKEAVEFVKVRKKLGKMER